MNFVDEIFMMEDTETAVFYTAVSTKLIETKFYDKYESAKINKIEITESTPEAHCRSNDVAEGRRGTKVVIRGTDYFIKEMHPDGTGITILLLTEDN